METWINATISVTADTASAAIDGVASAAVKGLQISEAGILVGTKKMQRLGSHDSESGSQSPSAPSTRRTMSRSGSRSPRSNRTSSGSPGGLPRAAVSDFGRISTQVVEGTLGGAAGAVEGMGEASKTAVRGTASAL